MTVSGWCSVKSAAHIPDFAKITPYMEQFPNRHPIAQPARIAAILMADGSENRDSAP
jgi:hypothetical protein